MLRVKNLGEVEINPQDSICILLNHHVPRVIVHMDHTSIHNLEEDITDLANPFFGVVIKVYLFDIRNIFNQDTVWTRLVIKTFGKSPIVEFLEIRLPARCFRVDTWYHPVKVRHETAFAEAAGLEMAICAAFILEKINGAEWRIQFIRLIRGILV